MEDVILYNGFKISIEQDQYADESPLDWTTPEERGATFALQISRYDLPFELDSKYDDNGDNIVDMDLYNSWDEFAKACAPADQQCYKFVRWYEHSGISVSLRDAEDGHDWDAGIAGVIFGTDDDAIKGSFADWKMYIEGDVYSVTVTDPAGEFVDSLGGIYGYEYAEAAGREMIDEILTQPRAGHKPVNASAMHN